MSKSIAEQIAEHKKKHPLDILDPVTGEVLGQEYVPPRLDAEGRELVSDISLAVSLNRPLALGDRLRRFQSMPQLSEDMYDPEDMDEIPLEDENPMSVHEDRTKELRQRVRQRKQAEADKAKADAIEKEKAEKAAFRKRYLEVRDDAAVPPDSDPRNAE